MIDELREPVISSVDDYIDGYNDEFLRSITARPYRATTPANRMGRPPRFTLTDERRELLIARYDGKKATYEGLAAATGVSIDYWGRWARELGLTRRPQVLVPSGTPESARQEEDAPPPADEPPTVPKDLVNSMQDAPTASPESPVHQSAPTPLRMIEPAKATHPFPTSMALDDRRLLENLVNRIPARWDAAAREKWLAALSAVLDLVVEIVTKGDAQ
jgi:hypothetical protein